MTSGILAALATVPGREVALRETLIALRPQVDRIHVVCHDFAVPPEAVRDLADDWICEPDVRGSAAKLHWARSHTGLYLGCDDDFRYPADYVATMQRWVRRWKGRALVTCHGRILGPRAKGFLEAVSSWPPRGANDGAWINYPGGCAIAFDTRLNVPDRVPGKNLEEAHLAVWAQETRTPIWLVPHAADFLEYVLPEGLPTIWHEEKAARFANRDAILSPLGKRAAWRIHKC